MTTLKQLTGPNKFLVGNGCVSYPAIAIGTSKAKINTTNAALFVIDGIVRSLSAQTSTTLVAAKAATHLPSHMANWRQPNGSDGAFYTQPVLTTVYYVFCCNAASTVVVVQGTYSGQALPNGQTAQGGVPDVPDGLAPWGMIKIVLANAATFVPATTEFDATDVTATYYNLSKLPSAAP